MSPLFRKVRVRAAQEAAALAELDRLRGLPSDELALEVLHAIGPGGVRGGNSSRARDVCVWLMRCNQVAFDPSPLRLTANVLKALKHLEHAGLAQRVNPDPHIRWKLTPLGEWALCEGAAADLVTAPALATLHHMRRRGCAANTAKPRVRPDRRRVNALSPAGGSAAS
jgi:hypothetical protein